MSRIAVDVHRLADFVERITAFQAHLDRVSEDVDARGHALHRTWTGAAAAAQATAHAQWRIGAGEAQEALAALRAIAAGAHANYLAAVHANGRMWR